MRRFFRTPALAFGLALVVAGTASAFVTISSTTTATLYTSVGETFEVDIFLSWDGAGSLTGVFASHGWDSNQLSLISAVFPSQPSFETRPIALKGGSYDPSLTRIGTLASGVAGDDLTSTARTVQYFQSGATPLLPASATTNELITRLTFQVIGIGDGIIEVYGLLLAGDGVVGDDLIFVDFELVPEPGTALLMGLGLAG